MIDMKNIRAMIIGSLAVAGAALSAHAQVAEPVKTIQIAPASRDAEVSLAPTANPVNMAQVQGMIHYPEAARTAGTEGKVIVRFLVDESGNQESHEILKSADPLFTAEIERVVPSLRFIPAMVNGNAVKSTVVIPFQFSLAK